MKLKMNFIYRVRIALFFSTSTLFAAPLPTLHIATSGFNPPFVIQDTKNEIYGFDIEMMNSLCKNLERTCRYHLMSFEQMLAKVAAEQIDIALGSITITAEREKIINFSLPYLPSYSRFLTKTSKKFPTPFNLKLLNGKKIGLGAGTVFIHQITALGISKATIKQYASVSDELEALSKNEVDMLLLDNATAIYWASNSSSIFQLIGPKYNYGDGLGIAVNPGNPALLTEINEALLQYQNSNEYKLNYNKYLLEF